MVETDESELPRIAENKRTVLLAKDEVIVFAGLKICGLDPQFSAHSKVNPKPVPARQGEEHLLAARGGAEQFLPNELTFDRSRLRLAEDAFFAVQLHRHNPFSEAGVPAFAKIFHLREFWHGLRLDRSRAPCYPWRAWKR